MAERCHFIDPLTLQSNKIRLTLLICVLVWSEIRLVGGVDISKSGVLDQVSLHGCSYSFKFQ